MWKPGQIVTINNRVYRVKKVDFKQYPYMLGVCNLCQARNISTGAPCIRGKLPQGYCLEVVGMKNYLELVCGSKTKS